MSEIVIVYLYSTKVTEAEILELLLKHGIIGDNYKTLTQNEED